MNKIGMMQGRLLPPVNGELQAFPGERWAEEFALAADCRFDCIEMIYDVAQIDLNPLDSPEGIALIQEATKETGVGVYSVCADYFMNKGFLRVSEQERIENLKKLATLTHQVEKLGVTNIVIPIVDQAEIQDESEIDVVCQTLADVIALTKDSNIFYALEMSLPAEKIVELLKKINHPRVSVNYDTGNSTALGYDLGQEIDLLHPWITSVHIKDRRVNGPSCLLGQGDTDFSCVFSKLSTYGYDGPYIIQAQRGANEIDTARDCYSFVSGKIITT